MSKAQKKEMVKIKQFEWFEVQTRVREIMSEVLQPFNKKQSDETVKMNELRRTLVNLSKKVQEHQFLLQKQGADKPSYLLQQDERILFLSNAIEEHYLRTCAGLNKMQIVIDVYQQKVGQLNEVERRLDAEVQQRRQDFVVYKQHLDEEIALMFRKQQSQQEDIHQFRSTTRLMVNKLEAKMVGFEHRLRELEDDAKRKRGQLDQLNASSQNVSERVVRVEQRLAGIAEKVEDREKDSKLSEKFLSKVKEVENDLKFIENFLQAYQPLYIQMHISQTLNQMVEGKQRRKLCLYEEKKFAKYHERILMDEKISLQEMMKNYSNNIRKITNRNKKYVINLTVQETVKYGTNVYEFRAENYEDVEEDVQRPINVIVPENDILRVVEAKWVQLIPQIKGVLQEQVQPTRQWMRQLQEQSLLRALDYDRKFEGVKKSVLESEANFLLNEKNTTHKLKEMSGRLGQVERGSTQNRECIRDVLNFSSVINHIVIQDEIDRQGTALYALQAKTDDVLPSPTFQLDTECVNCAGKTKAGIVQAFKAACLTYNPSQILIDQQLFTREEILEISTNILEKVKQKIDQGESSKSKTYGEKTIEKQTIERNIERSSVYETALKRKTISVTNKKKEMQTMLPAMSTRVDRSFY